MAQKIHFASLKGGTGVTSCCVGLGLALAERGDRTLIVDGDNLSGCAMTVCGCANMQVYTLADYERGACRAKQTLVAHPSQRNLCILPSLNCKDRSAAERAVTDLDGLFDYILCDKIAAKVCDRACIVTEPFLPSLKSADLCRAELADGGMKDVFLIVNKLSGGQILNGEAMTAQEIAAVLHLPLVAVIPEDLSLPAGKSRGGTLKAFRLAADSVSGKSGKIYNVLSGYFGAGGFFKRKLRSKI